MPDFPSARYLPPVISSISRYAIGIGLQLTGSAAPASGAWPSNNVGLFVQFTLPAPYPVRKVWWANGAAVAGNVDCSVETPGGAVLLSAGSTAQSGTSVVQSVTLGSIVLLQPGTYYMRLACSTTSAAFIRASPTTARLQMLGMGQQTSSVPVNSPATLATLGQSYCPVFGIARVSVI